MRAKHRKPRLTTEIKERDPLLEGNGQSAFLEGHTKLNSLGESTDSLGKLMDSVRKVAWCVVCIDRTAHLAF